MNGGLHPRVDVDRMYVYRDAGGRGLLSVEDVVIMERVALYHYLKNHPDALMEQVLSSGIVKTPEDVSIAPELFKDHLNASHFQGWQNKPLHGQYDLKIETESLILAAQDQALNTKYYNASILGGSDLLCRLCGSDLETVAHIVSGCSTLPGTSYKNTV